jgi:two-component system, LytTR family, sensor kinase
MARWLRPSQTTGFTTHDALGLSSRQSVQQVLTLVNNSAPVLRQGLSQAAACDVVPSLRMLLSVAAVLISDGERVLGWDADAGFVGIMARLCADPATELGLVRGVERSVVSTTSDATSEWIPNTSLVARPLMVDGHVAGHLAVFADDIDLALVAAVEEASRWLSTQVQLGDLDRAKATAAGAQLRALRAQISPHFLFNALNTIASFVRTDPDRARDLLIEFADFARYSFSTTGQFTTLADELRAIDTFVALERARFGDRLRVKIRVAPEVLGVRVPFLVLQPLVENALQHGLYRKGGQGELTLDAVDLGNDALIQLEDNGVGMDPELLEETLAGRRQSSGIGLRNVDERLRTVFGPSSGLVIETNIGAGTRITFSIPKSFPAGVLE